jgi:hypothetical protein
VKGKWDGRLGNVVISIRRALAIFYGCQCPHIQVQAYTYENVEYVKQFSLHNNRTVHKPHSPLCVAWTPFQLFYFSEANQSTFARTCNPVNDLDAKVATTVFNLNKTHSFGGRPCSESPYHTAMQVRNGDVFQGKFVSGQYEPGPPETSYHQPTLSFFLRCANTSGKSIAVLEGPTTITGNPVATVLKTMCGAHFGMDCFEGDLETSLYYLNCAKIVCKGVSTMDSIYRNPFNDQRVLGYSSDPNEKFLNNDEQRYSMLKRHLR